MRQIIYTHTGHNVIVGNFASGDTARLPDDLAHHFVEEAGCAMYAENEAVTPQPDVKTANKSSPSKKGSKK